jgi:thiol-disulfide isomerase/thioredoxin
LRLNEQGESKVIDLSDGFEYKIKVVSGKESRIEVVSDDKFFNYRNRLSQLLTSCFQSGDAVNIKNPKALKKILRPIENEINKIEATETILPNDIRDYYDFAVLQMILSLDFNKKNKLFVSRFLESTPIFKNEDINSWSRMNFNAVATYAYGLSNFVIYIRNKGNYQLDLYDLVRSETEIFNKNFEAAVKINMVLWGVEFADSLSKIKLIKDIELLTNSDSDMLKEASIYAINRSNTKLQSGDSLRDLKLILADDSDTSSIQLFNLSNRFVLLGFWFSSCAPCKESLPKIKALNADFSECLEVVGVNPFDTKGKIIHYKNNNELPWKTYKLESKSVLDDYLRVKYYPTFILIDTREKKILYYEDSISSFEKSLQDIRKLLTEICN